MNNGLLRLAFQPRCRDLNFTQFYRRAKFHRLKKLQCAFCILLGVQGQGRLMPRKPAPVGVLRLLFLQSAGIGKHDVA